uniref:Long-chain acyl-coa synthetase, putative n=1 Tax=Theileria annulata TaxID=5874 RepID=A0A3B0N7I6_THEAN
MENSEYFTKKTIEEMEATSNFPFVNFKYSKFKEKSNRSDESDVYCCVDDDHLSPKTKVVIPNHINSSFDMLCETAKYYGNCNHLGKREKIVNADGTCGLGEYVFNTYSDSVKYAKIIGTALTTENLVPESIIDNCKLVKKARFLGIWSMNCPYWLLTDYACCGYGFVSVPIYETLGDDALFKIMKTTKMEVACIDSKKITNLEHLFSESKQLKTVIVFDQLTENDKKRLEKLGLKYHLMDDLIEKYKDNYVDPPQTKRTDICTIIYTSGTSGTPKGAVYTNEGLIVLTERLFNVQNRCRISFHSCILSFLPLSHVYQRFIEHLIGSLVGRIGYYSGNIKTILDDLNKLSPNFLVAVPRVFTRILTRIRDQIDSKPWLVRKFISFFVEGKKRVFKKRPHKPNHFFYDLVIKKIKSKFGGKFDIMVLGSASMTDDDVLDIQAYMGTPLTEGWGTTELGVSILQDFRDTKKGTIGGPLYGVEFKLRSIEELEYDARGSPPRGELLVRARGIMLGYFADEDLTNEVLDDEGWYRTGDVVELLPNLGLKILDRARNFFKMSQGEYITPDKLENAYVNAKLVDQVFVHGEPTENHLVGIVVVSKENVELWAQVNGLGNKTVQELLNNEKLITRIRDDFEKIAKTQNFNSLERLKVFKLIDQPFSVEDGMLTPTFKSVRYKIKARYNAEIKKMYNDAKQAN